MSPPNLRQVSERQRGYQKEFGSATAILEREAGRDSSKLKAYFSESERFMELSLTGLELAYTEALFLRPEISFGDEPVWSGEDETGIEVQEQLTEDDEDASLAESLGHLEEYDLLECPEFEPDEDYQGESASLQFTEEGAAETLDSYMWRRFFEDFASEDDDIRNKAAELLSTRLSLSNSAFYRNTKQLSEPEWFHAWFNSVSTDYGPLIDERLGEGYQVDVPDIIFKYDDSGGLTYEVNMGIFDQVYLPDESQHNVNITIDSKGNPGPGIPLTIVKAFIAKRKAQLGILAEFLMQIQGNAITEKTIPEAMRNIESIQQKDLVAIMLDLKIADVEERAKTLVSRLLKGKLVQLPAVNVSIPVRAFFDRPVRNLKKTADAIEILQKAFEVHKGNPLTQAEQAAIVTKVSGTICSIKQVRSTLRAALREKYPEEQWPALGLSDGKAGRKLSSETLSDAEHEKLCKEISEALKNEQ